jgi:hypothetical protein
MFDNDALEEYFKRLSSTGITVTPQVRERFLFYCDGHPYLLEMLGYEVVELFRETGFVDVDLAAKGVGQSFIDHYEHMLEVLKEDEKFSKMLQILFGPVIDAKPTDAEELQRYGFIKLNNEDVYVAFSDHFQTYLRMIERHVDLWPLWRETEMTLRRVITERMIEHYGDQWIEMLCKEKPNMRTIFEKSEEAQKKEEKSFGDRASRNLVDFMYPKDLFDIICAKWSIFSGIFGKNKNYWDHRAQLLSKVRNPLAHNRDMVLYDYERRIAEGYCGEILAVLEKY